MLVFGLVGLASPGAAQQSWRPWDAAPPASSAQEAVANAGTAAPQAAETSGSALLLDPPSTAEAAAPAPAGRDWVQPAMPQVKPRTVQFTGATPAPTAGLAPARAFPTPQGPINDKRIRKYTGADAGLFVVSSVAGVTLQGRLSSPLFCVRRIDNGEWRAIGPNESKGKWFRPFTIPKYNDLQPVGYVHAEPLPPGKYELYRVDFHWWDCKPSNDRGWSIYTPLHNPPPAEPDFSIPFEVKAGRAVYFGSLMAWSNGARVNTGLFDEAHYAVRLTLSNESERDLGYAREKFPQLYRTPVDIEVVDANALGIPGLINRAQPEGAVSPPSPFTLFP